MSRFGFLHRVNCQCADSVDTKLVEFRRGVSFFLHSGAHDFLKVTSLDDGLVRRVITHKAEVCTS